jgi:tRNA(fMet)-specific endonuclease VapC
MSKYMLDTDICIFITRKSEPSLLERIESVPLEQQCISVVTLAELLYGVQVSSKKKANQEVVDLFAQHIEVLEWTPDAAKHYAEIRADLKKKGQQLGSNNLLIAAHARSIGAVIVTNNVKDFGRVKGLKLENWMQ